MSVFVIFTINYNNESDDIVGYKLTKDEAKLFCDTKNRDRVSQTKAYEEYVEMEKEYSDNLQRLVKHSKIDIHKVRDEYFTLRDKPKPDLSKIPQERHEFVLQRYNDKVGNRLKELEKYINMSIKEIEKHNKDIYNEATKELGQPPSKVEEPDDNKEYYYKEVQELP
jgi:hypothetical protein